jgi:two-component system, sensor histidine kinase and response regulator
MTQQRCVTMSDSYAMNDVSLAAEPVSPIAGRGTLLVVDDEEGPRRSIRAMFKDDHDVLLAEDAPSALELARANKVDVAVLDIRLVGMSGLELLDRLKALEPSLEAVIVTAYESMDTLRRALRLHVCDLITKPFEVPVLRAAVASALHRHRLACATRSGVEESRQLLGELQGQRMQEQMLRTRNEIYGSIMHDINGPLTVIAGFAEVADQRITDARRLGAKDLEFIKKQLRTINQQAANCVEISRRYLGFLRRRSEEDPRVGFNQLLADLTRFIQVHPSRQNVHFSVQPLAEDAALRMNGADAIQMLLNLVVNAFQCSTDRHSVEIQASLVLNPLDLRVLEDGPRDRVLNVEGFLNVGPLVAVAVRDHGPGIPPELLPKIFEPYFTTKPEREGTGLGLNIVQRLVRDARGMLHVHTKAGEGSTFTVYLPAVTLARKAQNGPPAPPE